MATYLRCLTCIELYENAKYYADHPLFHTKHAEGAFDCVRSAFIMALSSPALDSLELSDPYHAVIAEAIVNANDKEYSSFLCLIALASVIGRPIQAHFPVRYDFSDLDKRSSVEIFYNSLVLPRQSCLLSNGTIHLLRCAAVPLDFLKTGKIPERKNHYVPLVSFPIVITGKKRKGQFDTATVSHSQTVIPFQAPVASTSMSVLPKKQTLLPKKQKQLSIDSFTTQRLPLTDPHSGKVSTQPSYPDPVLASSFTVSTNETINHHEDRDSDATIYSNQPCISSVIASHSVRDIGLLDLDASALSDADKYDILCNVWKPGPDYCFPKNSLGRRFQHKWLDQFSWLAYSDLLDGAFCLNCVLFGGESGHNAGKLLYLFKAPFSNWSKAMQKLQDHAIKSPVHMTATVMATEFRRFMENKTIPVDMQLNKLVCKQIAVNREKLKPIVEAIVMCGRQNIPLRGHRDSSAQVQDDSNNPGNLHAILRLLAICGNNEPFNEHFEGAARNATYQSKTTQNELLKICGTYISQTLVAEIVEAKFFAVLADEAADISNTEQMAIVVRFVDQDCTIREEFLGFVPCEGLSGEAIAKQITDSVCSLGLDMQLCRGQGYDGAGNMAGKVSGAAARILRLYPKALYVHCGSHILNLCVASACSMQVVRNMMGNVRVVSEFFNVHPKRFRLLKDKITSLLPTASHSRLLDVCRTRWIARIDGLEIFIELFEVIVAALNAIKENENGTWNYESIRDASGLFHSIVEFRFLFTLIVVSRCLEVTRPLTKQLQSPTMDTVKCLHKLTLLSTVLRKRRLEISAHHQVWFDEAIAIAETVGTAPSKPRTVSVQHHRDNTPSDSVTDYYRRSVTVPFLDHLISQMSTRFSDKNLSTLDGFFGLPSQVVCQNEWKEKFRKYLSLYRDDLPEPRFLETEMWEASWHDSDTTPPSSLQSLLPAIDGTTFPNIYVAFKILATLPVTSCTCERSISVLRRLKTYLRGTMSQDRLDALALLHVHRSVPINTEHIIDIFARNNPRRMKLIDILNSDP